MTFVTAARIQTHSTAIYEADTSPCRARIHTCQRALMLLLLNDIVILTAHEPGQTGLSSDYPVFGQLCGYLNLTVTLPRLATKIPPGPCCTSSRTWSIGPILGQRWRVYRVITDASPPLQNNELADHHQQQG